VTVPADVHHRGDPVVVWSRRPATGAGRLQGALLWRLRCPHPLVGTEPAGYLVAYPAQLLADTRATVITVRERTPCGSCLRCRARTLLRRLNDEDPWQVPLVAVVWGVAFALWVALPILVLTDVL
jgi:hypothetical protein